MEKSTFTEKVLEAEQTLYHVAKSILIFETDCEDAVQEAILNAYAKLNSLKDERYFKTWLVRILINECYRKKRSAKITVPYEEFLDTEQADIKEDYTELYQAVMTLNSRIRITIVLYYIEGYSVEEIKSILKIPAGTVKSRLAKGRKLLKSKLEESESRPSGGRMEFQNE